MVRNLRSLFQRARCTEQELRTLHGVVTAFAGPRERGKSCRIGRDRQRIPGLSPPFRMGGNCLRPNR